MKRWIAMFSALAILIMSEVSVPALAAGLEFSDVPVTHWAYNYIETAADNGWVNGVGDGKYDPDGKVTGAEWVTMVMRAFYADEIESAQSGDRWYQPYMDAANKYDLLRPEVNNFGSLERAYSRYEMASLIGNVLVQKGIDVPSIDTSKIGDLDHVPPVYEQAVIDSYSAGILVGNNDAGDFCGDDEMTRAQAAVVLVRMDNVINKGILPEPEEPDQPEEPDGTYGEVGTLSDTKVTLSYETHKPVTDYWSSAPADIRAITDQEAYNCAVQTLKDKNIIWDENVINEDGLNPYYNYAVFRYELTDKESNVTTAIGKMNGYVGFGNTYIKRNADGTTDRIFSAGKRPNSEDYDAVIDPILARLNDGMSDYEKAEIMVQAIVDRFDYNAGGDFEWPDPVGSSGACGPFGHAVNDIFNAAGIPCIWTSSTTHAWNYAYLDGSWWVVDASAADVNGNNASMAFRTDIDSFQGGPGETDRIAMALVESALG